MLRSFVYMYTYVQDKFTLRMRNSIAHSFIALLFNDPHGFRPARKEQSGSIRDLINRRSFSRHEYNICIAERVTAFPPSDCTATLL